MLSKAAPLLPKEPTEISETQKEFARLAMEDLFFFNQYILGNGPAMNEGLHREMCDFATGYRGASTKKKRLILEPRFTLKSTCVTIAYSLQSMLAKPNTRILIDSENLSQAKSFLSSIKNQCETNERYRQLAMLLHNKWPAPEKALDEKWTNTEIVSPLRIDKSIKEPTISTAGVDVVKVGQHYDKIIMDDPVSHNNTGTQEQIQKVIDHYKLALSLLDPGGELIIIGTRWNFGDLYGYIMENHKDFFDILIRQAYKEDGSLLFPEKLSEDFLKEQKISQGSYIFSCQYLNSPVPRDDAAFKWNAYREWKGEAIPENGLLQIAELRRYTGESDFTVEERSLGVKVNFFLTIDPAIAEKERSDPTAMVVIGMDPGGRMFVVDYVNKKISGMAFFDELFRLVDTYRPIRVGVETIAYQKSLIYSIRDEMKKRGTYFVLEELKPDRDKIRRIEALQPRYEAGSLYVRTGMDDLKYQMLNFPRTTHDDIVDALAYHLQLAYPKRVKEEQEKKRVAYRSPITRY